jgi:hypothetical protein
MDLSLRGRRVAAAGFASLAVLSIAVVVTPAANAQEGRRICAYSSVSDNKDKDGNLVSKSVWALDTRKDGACPVLTNAEALKNGASRDSKPKQTCESLRDALGLGEDPCPKMANDDITAVIKWIGGRNDYYSYGKYNG